MSVRRNTVEHQQGRSRDDVQIGVRDLGPIADGQVDLRPLTVFVGPSNTGKTYMSILIYALHQVLGGFRPFPAFPRRFRYPYYRSQARRSRSTRFDESSLSEHDYSQIRRTLAETEKPFMYHDLPIGLRSALQTNVKESGAELELELNRCFDSASLSELIRTWSSKNDIKISLQAPNSANVSWHMNMSLLDDRSTASGEVEDFVLIPEIGRSRRYDRNRRILSEILVQNRKAPVFFILEEMANLVSRTGDRVRPSGIHYLPAARSGIMQSHRVIASSLVIRSTRAGLERFPALPAFSGVMADFMQQLIMYRNERDTHPTLDQIAKELEKDTLAGLVGLGPSPGGYPEFIYRPHGTKDDVSMTRASSMVSELAPLVLFLRGVIGKGDTLIIEEPEAHLHPAAQTSMAITLGRLVRAGVRVLITTHSDWLLKQIGNLMREGEINEQTGEAVREDHLPSVLHPSEVGTWLFRQSATDSGSTIQEIPFDRSEGVEPEEYYDVAEELYNRSADLQNRLEESRGP